VPNSQDGVPDATQDPIKPHATYTYRFTATRAAVGMYPLNGKSVPATAPVVAKSGEWVEVHYLNEGVMAHPLHLHGLDQLVIAKDGYPLAAPVGPASATPSS
jgi:FtsP/CotA-like multicopper oxidase with cupredoxin domain